jgi:hypothetical protein
LPLRQGPINPEFALIRPNRAVSTLAVDGSEDTGENGAAATVVRYLDLPLLAIALPAFLALDAPMLGYGVLAGVWLVQLGVERFADARAAAALRRGDRRAAMGWVGATGLGRVWLVALAVLLVGLAEREAAVAAAILAVVLFTTHLGARVLARALSGEERS